MTVTQHEISNVSTFFTGYLNIFLTTRLVVDDDCFENVCRSWKTIITNILVIFSKDWWTSPLLGNFFFLQFGMFPNIVTWQLPDLGLTFRFMLRCVVFLYKKCEIRGRFCCGPQPVGFYPLRVLLTRRNIYFLHSF